MEFNKVAITAYGDQKKTEKRFWPPQKYCICQHDQCCCNRGTSAPLFWCLCIVLQVPVIFQISEHQVRLEGDKYVEPSSTFVCQYGDPRDIRDNQITASVREWSMSRVKFVMPRMKGNNFLSVCNGLDALSALWLL